MELKTQRRLAAQIFKCSAKKVYFDPEKLSSIKEALTSADIRDLINSNAIVKKSPQSQSRVRARKIQVQKRKGLRKGLGSRKGTPKARLNPKETWMIKVRLQRSFIKELKDKKLIAVQTYRQLYLKVKGNYFRNKRHVKEYIEQEKLWQ